MREVILWKLKLFVWFLRGFRIFSVFCVLFSQFFSLIAVCPVLGNIFRSNFPESEELGVLANPFA